MKITFIGAAHEVTGSCTLLEVGSKHYLVDKGMEQGVDLFENVPLPITPEEQRRVRHPCPYRPYRHAAQAV